MDHPISAPLNRPNLALPNRYSPSTVSKFVTVALIGVVEVAIGLIMINKPCYYSDESSVPQCCDTELYAYSSHSEILLFTGFGFIFMAIIMICISTTLKDCVEHNHNLSAQARANCTGADICVSQDIRCSMTLIIIGVCIMFISLVLFDESTECAYTKSFPDPPDICCDIEKKAYSHLAKGILIGGTLTIATGLIVLGSECLARRNERAQIHASV